MDTMVGMKNIWPYRVPDRLPSEPPHEYLGRCLSVWGSRAHLARAIPCQPGIIGLYCSGQLVPRLTAGDVIERLIGIPASEWASPAHQPWERAAWAGGDASTALRSALARRGAQAAMARVLGVTPMQMSQMCAGRRCPSIAQARILDREIGIPWTAWFSADAARAALGRQEWRVAGAAGQAILEWADDWDRWCLPSSSWVRLGMSEERMRAVVAGAPPTPEERERALTVAGVPARLWS